MKEYKEGVENQSLRDVMPRPKKQTNSSTQHSKTSAAGRTKRAAAGRGKKAETAKKTPKIPSKRTSPKKGAAVSERPAAKSFSLKAPKAGSSPGASQLSRSFRIKRQGQTQMIAFIRDSRCLFAYWEISNQSLEDSKKYFGHEFTNSYRVLRVFKTGSQGEEILAEEIRIPSDDMNRYIPLQESGGSYILEVGQKSVSGRYFPFARSNRVTTAIASLSPVTDPKWEPPAGILEYFDEGVEETLEPEKRGFSASMPPGRTLSRRKFGPGGRHAASHF
jgi:hypothetical protein